MMELLFVSLKLIRIIVYAASDPNMAVADPFTGAGAYVPSGDASGPMHTSANPDPFTGGGAYVPGDAGASSSRPSLPHPAGLRFTPHQHYQGFEAVPDENKVIAKLRELAPAVQGDVALTASELAAGGPLEDIVQVNAMSHTPTFSA